ncbi:magnesium transporter [Candidatus Woesearchaeota archaeon]|nr:magnesium transporter [Candidatus Woesearchaeota archaeon]
MTTKKAVQNDISYRLISSPKKSILKEIPIEKRGFVLLGLSKIVQQKLLDQLNIEEIVNVIHYLAPDESTDILQNILDQKKRKSVIFELSPETRKKVEFLLTFNPRTAAGLMSLDYVKISNDLNFSQVSNIIQEHEKRTGKFPTLLVVDKQDILVGELPGHVFALRKKTEKIKDYIEKVPTIKHDKDEKRVLRVFKKHPGNKIVVLDGNKKVLGVIYSDDVIKLMNKESTRELYESAGVSEEESIHDSAYKKVKYRYKWLILNLATAFLAASVVGLFKDTISSFVLLAAYMPVVAGMGGNAGTQTLAVVVRGLALKEIELRIARKVIINEVIAGAINGIINGALVAMVALTFNQNLVLGIVTGVAIMFNLMTAGFFGAIVPLIMKHFKKDPASSATIFITTATDVIGFFTFLGLASLIL